MRKQSKINDDPAHPPPAHPVSEPRAAPAPPPAPEALHPAQLSQPLAPHRVSRAQSLFSSVFSPLCSTSNKWSAHGADDKTERFAISYDLHGLNCAYAGLDLSCAVSRHRGFCSRFFHVFDWVQFSSKCLCLVCNPRLSTDSLELGGVVWIIGRSGWFWVQSPRYL